MKHLSAPLHGFCALLLFLGSPSFALSEEPKLVMELPEPSVQTLEFSYDGRKLLVGAGDVTSVWELKTQERQLIAGGNYAGYSPDGKTIASVKGRYVTLTDAITLKERAKLMGYDWMYQTAFSPNGRWLAGGSLYSDRFNLPTCSNEYRETKRPKGMHRAAYIKDSRYVNILEIDRNVCIWDILRDKEIASLKGHQGRIRSLVLSQTKNILASGSKDKTVRLWDTKNWKEQLVPEGHTSTVTAVAFTLDDKVLASAAEDGVAIVWDVKTGKKLHTIQAASELITAIAFSPDGGLLATGSDESVKIWKMDDGK